MEVIIKDPWRVTIKIPKENAQDFAEVCKLQDRTPSNFVLHAMKSELKKAVSRYQNQGKM